MAYVRVSEKDETVDTTMISGFHLRHEHRDNFTVLRSGRRNV